MCACWAGEPANRVRLLAVDVRRAGHRRRRPGAGRAVGASSSDVTYPAYNATDGNPETRWAVDRTQRGRQDSWIAVDLGSEVTVAGVRTVVGGRVRHQSIVIQTSLDARDLDRRASVPDDRGLTGGWVDIDGRAGLVTHGSDRADHGDRDRRDRGRRAGVTARHRGIPGPPRRPGHAGPPPAAHRADGLRVSDADGYLSVFNLTPDAGRPARRCTIPSADRLYRGAQVARGTGLAWSGDPAGRHRPGRAATVHRSTARRPTAPASRSPTRTTSRSSRRPATRLVVTVRAGPGPPRSGCAAGRSRSRAPCPAARSPRPPTWPAAARRSRPRRCRRA